MKNCFLCLIQGVEISTASRLFKYANIKVNILVNHMRGHLVSKFSGKYKKNIRLYQNVIVYKRQALVVTICWEN